MSNSNTIYADYQATTPVDPRVLAKMAPYWRESFGNPHSADHIIGWQAAESIRDAAAAVAGLIGADGDEIVFTSGATESNNLALLGLARRAPADRRRLLVSAIEHKCVLAAARALAEREGFDIETVPVDRGGFVDLDALQATVDETVLAVSIMAVNNEIGTIQDLAAIARIVAPHGVLFHCDAAQAPMAMAMQDVARHVDLLSLSAHKFYGPKGIGALYIRREVQDRMEPLIYGGGQQGDLRSGTVPVPLCVGTAAAVEIICLPEAVDERDRLRGQRDHFLTRLRETCDLRLNGPDGDDRHPCNANLQFQGFAAHDLLASLQPNLAASTGAACSSGAPEPSHVLRAIGLSMIEAESSVRFSFGRFTTDEQVDRAAGLIENALQRLASEGLRHRA